MENADHGHVLASSTIENQIVFKPSDWKYAHTLQICLYKIAYTAHAGQRQELCTRCFQCRHKSRCRIRIVRRDKANDVERILPGLRGQKRRGKHSCGYECFDLMIFAASALSR